MQYLTPKKTLQIAIAAGLLLIITGCGVSNSDSSGDQSVSVTMRVNNSSAPNKLAKMKSVQAVDSLSEVKILVEELELESSFDEDSLDFEVDDLIVNLPLDGSDFELVSATVPEGVYDEFEMEIEHDDDSNVNDPDFINESGDDDDGYTVVIKGVYNGENFTYRSEEDFEIEMDLNPPLEVSSNSSPSIAINIEPLSWFKDSSGNDLDPNDPNNRETIDDNIANSFDAEQEDDDDDNDDDDNNDDDDDDDDDDDSDD